MSPSNCLLSFFFFFSMAGLLFGNALFRRDNPENPSAVTVQYNLAWLNKQAGLFGAQLTITQGKPTTPPTFFSLKLYFNDQYTTVQEFWGDCAITHYTSGAHHIQPDFSKGKGGVWASHFNGVYNISQPNESPDFAFPGAFSLLNGLDFNSTESNFLVDEVNITKSIANLGQVPSGEYVRTQSLKSDSVSKTNPVSAQSTDTAAAPPPKAGNVPIIAGAGVATILVVGVAAYLLMGKSKKNSEKKDVFSDLSRQGSNRGHVEHQPIQPHVEQANITMVAGADYSPESKGEYYDGSGYVMLDAASEPSQRQMSLVMHYALPPGQGYTEVEGDDYGLHQQLTYGAIDEGNYMASHVTEDAYTNDISNHQMPPPTTPIGDFFLAEEVIDGTETTQATPIDHAYVENAIGYHQAQIEQRIRLDDERNADSFPPLSPMLTLTGAGGEMMFFDQNDYSIYEDPSSEHHGGGKLSRKASQSSLRGGNYL